MNTFQEIYDTLKHEFLDKHQFTTSTPLNNRFDWPDGSGVYTIWEVDSEVRRLLYIGMCGTFNRDDAGAVRMNQSTFPDRKRRWTPYRFAESTKDDQFRYHFRFGPKEKDTRKQGLLMNHRDGYSTSIPYEKISIDFFVIEDWNDRYTPALVESMLLTSYLKEFKTLPPANNSL